MHVRGVTPRHRAFARGPLETTTTLVADRANRINDGRRSGQRTRMLYRAAAPYADGQEAVSG